MAAVVVSVHDVAPATFDESREWVQLLDHYGICATLLVVPGPWESDGLQSSPAFIDWLHKAASKGHEVSLHGWEHRGVADPNGPGVASPWAVTRRSYGRMIARGCGEFHNLGRVEAKRRLRAGLDEMRTAGFEPVGFTPPGWLASHDAIGAMRQLGFAYTTTQWAVLDFIGNRRLPIPALSQRPGSPLTAAAGLANEQIIRRRLRGGRSVRVALHPRDLDHRALIDSTERTFARIDAARFAGVHAVTYCDLVTRTAVARDQFPALASPRAA
ncbi:MAG: polysaccharide deacetylase family protein [Actinomycetota bacterium]|jgi:hypothetical protein